MPFNRSHTADGIQAGCSFCVTVAIQHGDSELEMSTGRNFSARPGPFGTFFGPARPGPFHFQKISARFGPFISAKIFEIFFDKQPKKSPVIKIFNQKAMFTLFPTLATIFTVDFQ